VRARRGWGWPLVPVYAAGLAVKDGLRAIFGPRALGVWRTRRLAWPVVSVGSLSAGGAGKTPVVIALAELLQARGWGVDVLSRGYGRSGRGVELVYVGAENAAGRFGDEPVVIARRTGVRVWVGAGRFAVGVAAEAGEGQKSEAVSSAALRNDKQESEQRQEQSQVQEQEDRCYSQTPGRVHLLDDGFQHRGLGRAVDVVLVTEEDLEDALLPAGNRREGLRALRRADVVVLREEERGRVEGRVRRLMRAEGLIWRVKRQISFVEAAPVLNDSRGLNSEVATFGYVVFSAIARPENFVRMLREVGINPLEVVTFADHHAYTDDDVERLVNAAGECGGAGFITTEKDAVKLTAEMRWRLEAVGPVCVARLDVTFVDEARVVRDVEAKSGEERIR
jgi:tetraacyldisaccharide 4'-kinase